MLPHFPLLHFPLPHFQRPLQTDGQTDTPPIRSRSWARQKKLSQNLYEEKYEWRQKQTKKLVSVYDEPIMRTIRGNQIAWSTDYCIVVFLFSWHFPEPCNKWHHLGHIKHVDDDDADTDRFQFLTPSKQRWYADECRQDPDRCNHGDHVFHCALDGVLKRASNDEVAVDADRTQVQYRRRAQQDVEWCPRVTHGAIERPVFRHL